MTQAALLGDLVLVFSPSCCSTNCNKVLPEILVWSLINFHWLKSPRAQVSNNLCLWSRIIEFKVFLESCLLYKIFRRIICFQIWQLGKTLNMKNRWRCYFKSKLTFQVQISNNCFILKRLSDSHWPSYLLFEFRLNVKIKQLSSLVSWATVQVFTRQTWLQYIDTEHFLHHRKFCWTAQL